MTGAVTNPVWPLVAAARLAEPTWLPLPVQAAAGELAGCVEPQAAAAVAEKAAGYDAFVLGCGLGNNAATRTFVRAAVAQPGKAGRGSGHADQVAEEQGAGATHVAAAHLIDADGLNCLAALPDWPRRSPPRTVLTPHPAEMALGRAGWRLAGSGLALGAACEQAAAGGCTVLLKGPYTVVAAPAGLLGVLPIATPALATAGSGDVLSGIVGGLLAQGLELFAGGLRRGLPPRAGRACRQGGAWPRRGHCFRPAAATARRSPFSGLEAAVQEPFMSTVPPVLTAANTRIVVDMLSNVPDDLIARYRMIEVPTLVILGEDAYQNKHELSEEAFYEKFAAAKALPTTSQPLPAFLALPTSARFVRGPNTSAP